MKLDIDYREKYKEIDIVELKSILNDDVKLK